MIPSYTIKTNTQGFSRAFSDSIRIETDKFLDRVGIEFAGRMQDQFRVKLVGPMKRNPSRNGLARRSGGLARSIGHQVATDGSGVRRLVVFIGGRNYPYARAHEYGAIIRPKRSKYLTIPLRDNLTGAGLSRYPSPRAVPDSFVIKSRKGNLIIVRRKESGDLEFLWALVKQVRIPPRLGFRRVWSNMRERQEELLKEAVARAVATATRRAGPTVG